MSDMFMIHNPKQLTDKINIDELYEQKRLRDLNNLNTFNRVLHNVHKKIQTVSHQRIDNTICWYHVPEIIFGGTSRYDQAACIAYLTDRLKENGFMVRYVHPSHLLISWGHWVPSYVRNEIKKKTGLVLNEFGEEVKDAEDNGEEEEGNTSASVSNTSASTRGGGTNPKDSGNKYTPIKSYKPSGGLVYDDELLHRIGTKLQKR